LDKLKGAVAILLVYEHYQNRIGNIIAATVQR
jgi:hypothetical protein